VIRKLAADGRKVRILSLGYPDLLVTEEALRYLGLDVDYAAIAIRPNSEAVWKGHSMDVQDPMFETKSFFECLGASFEAVDYADNGNAETILDLNKPLPGSMKEQYDLVVDPGTIEHCFDVAQAVSNAADAAKVGGYVFHQAAICYINHGFYSISPTFFVDFYEANGFSISQPCFFNPVWKNGIVCNLAKVECFWEGGPASARVFVGRYFFKKIYSANPICYPIQRKYSGLPQAVIEMDVARECLPASLFV